MCLLLEIQNRLKECAVLGVFYVNFKDLPVQSHYSVCIAYANFRKRMQILEHLLYAQLLTPPLYYKPLQMYK